MAFQPDQRFNELPLLPPEATVKTVAVMERCIGAARALAHLKGLGETIPNQEVLINAIPLQEARLSSEIENIVTTQDKLFHAALDESKSSDPNTKEVLRYRTALREGSEAMQKQNIDLVLIQKICATLRANPDIQFRDEDEQVYIGNPLTKRASYTPPLGKKLLTAKLENLVEYLNASDDTDPLVRLAVSHYQFEAIHPFDDGNGRTGRILNILYLLQSGLLSIPVLYLSRYIIENKQSYYQLLQNVTEKGEWEGWILFILAAVRETSESTASLILSIKELFDLTLEKCRNELPKRVYSKELVETIFIQPYCKIANVMETCQVERKTASDYLKELQKMGVLKSEKIGSEMIYRHPNLIQLLSA